MKAIGTRPKIIVSADGRGVVGHAGARLLADVADATGVTGAVSEALAGLRQRQGGHDPGRCSATPAAMTSYPDIIRAVTGLAADRAAAW